MRRNECHCDGCAGQGDASEGAAHRARTTTAATAVGDGRAAVRDAEDGATDECAGGDEETCQRFLRLGHHGKFALEGLASPPQQRFDGPDLHALVVGDLLIRPTRPLAHGEHVTVARRQATEGTVHELTVDRGQNQLLGGVFNDHTDRVLCGELHLVGRCAAGAPAQHVGADVACDHGEPRVEAPLARKTRKSLPGSGECFLRRVLGLVPVVQPAKAEAEKALVVARVEVPEGSRVAGLAALDECAVPIEIDVVTKACQLFFA